MSNKITEFELISRHLVPFKFTIKNLFTYQLLFLKVYRSPEGHHHYVGLSEQLGARMEKHCVYSACSITVDVCCVTSVSCWLPKTTYARRISTPEHLKLS